MKAACPVCGRPAKAAHRRFCSPRCADIDLGRWLGGHYVTPGEPLDETALAALPGEACGPADDGGHRRH